MLTLFSLHFSYLSFCPSPSWFFRFVFILSFFHSFNDIFFPLLLVSHIKFYFRFFFPFLFVLLFSLLFSPLFLKHSLLSIPVILFLFSWSFFLLMLLLISNPLTPVVNDSVLPSPLSIPSASVTSYSSFYFCRSNRVFFPCYQSVPFVGDSVQTESDNRK